MSQRPISRFSVPEIADAPDDIRSRMLAVQEKSGFVPNVFLVLARRPDEFRAFFAYHDALMDKPGNLHEGRARDDRRGDERRQPVPILRRRARRAILRIQADPLIADQIAVNYRKADITDRQKAMLDFAMKAALEALAVGEADFEALRRHGFTTRMPGTSPRSARSSPCPIASPMWAISEPMPNSTCSRT